jgi:hypothetical protein
MSTSTSTDLQLKDRKKSAHWSDADTDILMNVLVRHKDAGRTSDNGFKPEVWREAAGLFERTTFVGGAKSADACKSRWQRVSGRSERVECSRLWREEWGGSREERERTG